MRSEKGSKMNERIKDILAKPVFERLRDWVNIGPVQRATVEEFADALVFDILNELTNDDTLGPARIETIRRLAQRYGVAR